MLFTAGIVPKRIVRLIAVRRLFITGNIVNKSLSVLGSTYLKANASLFGGRWISTRGIITNPATISKINSVYPMVENGHNTTYTRIGYWMVGLAGMTFGAIVIGGITRLTESGLSMVRWHPIYSGIPMNEADWEEEYAAYKQYPEYQYNKVSLEEFKRIFFWECFHRVWGRTIGGVFIVPYMGIIFMPSSKVSHRLKLFSTMIGLLIGFQGALGWYMVRSGLKENDSVPQHNWIPRVSQYRLAAHLSSALVLFSLTLSKGLYLIKTSANPIIPPYPPVSIAELSHLSRFSKYIKGGFLLTFLTACSGAFVAGLDAGLVYNTFPYMGNGLIPDDLFALTPWLTNFTENSTTVQFDHRILGTSTFLAMSGLYYYSRRLTPLLARSTRNASAALMAIVSAQFLLGLTTLLTFVPIPLASAHQATSVVLLSTLIYLHNDIKLQTKYIRHIIH